MKWHQNLLPHKNDTNLQKKDAPRSLRESARINGLFRPSKCDRIPRVSETNKWLQCGCTSAAKRHSKGKHSNLPGERNRTRSPCHRHCSCSQETWIKRKTSLRRRGEFSDWRAVPQTNSSRRSRYILHRSWAWTSYKAGRPAQTTLRKLIKCSNLIASGFTIKQSITTRRVGIDRAIVPLPEPTPQIRLFENQISSNPFSAVSMILFRSNTAFWAFLGPFLIKPVPKAQRKNVNSTFCKSFLLFPSFSCLFLWI